MCIQFYFNSDLRSHSNPYDKSKLCVFFFHFGMTLRFTLIHTCACNKNENLMLKVVFLCFVFPLQNEETVLHVLQKNHTRFVGFAICTPLLPPLHAKRIFDAPFFNFNMNILKSSKCKVYAEAYFALN